MDNTRTIKCDCGTQLQEKETVVDHISTRALVCASCGFTSLTKKQAKEFRKKVELHKAIDQERRIIKIGNSMGITLPDKLREYGVTIGGKIKIEAIDEQSFKVLL